MGILFGKYQKKWRADIEIENLKKNIKSGFWKLWLIITENLDWNFEMLPCEYLSFKNLPCEYLSFLILNKNNIANFACEYQKYTHSNHHSCGGKPPHSGWFSCVYFVIFTRKIGDILVIQIRKIWYSHGKIFFFGYRHGKKKILIFTRQNFVFLISTFCA